MPNTQTIAQSLQTSLELALPPIAITLTDTIPDGVVSYGDRTPAGCTFWQTAAKGAFATEARDHEGCAIGVHTHNLAGRSDSHAGELRASLEIMGQLGYVREEDIPGIPTMQNPVRHVIYAPLAEAPLFPDVVMLFADARRGLVIAEAVQQVEPELPPALGRPACAVVPHAINTGRAAMSLGCCGARAYLDAMTDDVALWALPGSHLEQYAERITALAEANTLLGKFHSQRRRDVEAGGTPTVADSLARLEGAS